MIIEYDRSPNATTEQKIKSLAESVMRALEEIHREDSSDESLKEDVTRIKQQLNSMTIERNADYPSFTNYWRWEKYPDGTFKAEYKRSITTGTLSESAAIDNMMYYPYEVNLPFKAISFP